MLAQFAIRFFRDCGINFFLDILRTISTKYVNGGFLETNM